TVFFLKLRIFLAPWRKQCTSTGMLSLFDSVIQVSQWTRPISSRGNSVRRHIVSWCGHCLPPSPAVKKAAIRHELSCCKGIAAICGEMTTTSWPRCTDDHEDHWTATTCDGDDGVGRLAPRPNIHTVVERMTA